MASGDLGFRSGDSEAACAWPLGATLRASAMLELCDNIAISKHRDRPTRVMHMHIMHSVSLQKGGQFAIEFIILVLALRVAVEACMWLVAVLSCGAVLRCGCLDQLSYFLFELACL
jgi:hypothetical protein